MFFENWQEIRRRIDDAARRAGRKPEDITLVAVSKTVDVDTVKEAFACGQVDFGENRVQELVAKANALPGARWHFIGRLQTNKVRDVVRYAYLVHSMDRDDLAKELNRRAAKEGRIVPVLLEVNVSGEVTKAGFNEEEVWQWMARASEYEHLKVMGLMTMAPYSDDPENSRPVFFRLKRLFDAIQKEDFPNVEMKYLSMGMSGDFEVAIEEGANIVRIGTALFGERKR